MADKRTSISREERDRWRAKLQALDPGQPCDVSNRWVILLLTQIDRLEDQVSELNDAMGW